MAVRAVLFLFTIALISATAGASDRVDPTLTFLENGIRAEGIVPGGEAVFFIVAHEPRPDDFAITTRDLVVVDTDRDGSVSFETAVPFHSICVVVDLTNGKLAIATPSGFEQVLPAVPDTRVAKNANGSLSIGTFRLPAAEILVVRPGSGAWRLSAFEGGKLDADGRNDGVLTVAPEHFAPVRGRQSEGSPLHAGDVIVLVDPRSMSFASLRLSAE